MTVMKKIWIDRPERTETIKIMFSTLFVINIIMFLCDHLDFCIGIADSQNVKLAIGLDFLTKMLNVSHLALTRFEFSTKSWSRKSSKNYFIFQNKVIWGIAWTILSVCIVATEKAHAQMSNKEDGGVVRWLCAPKPCSKRCALAVEQFYEWKLHRLTDICANLKHQGTVLSDS